MLKSKKVVAGLAALSLAGVSFAEVELSFSNKVSSDIVNIESAKQDDDSIVTTYGFAGVENNTVVEFVSDKVDAALDISFFMNTIDSTNSNGEDYTYVKFFGDEAAVYVGYLINDYYIEYRPFEVLTFGFHDTINTDGSYLPVWDDNAATGNLGSDFVVCLRPITGLRIASGFDFVSSIGADKNEPYNNFILNFGIDYTLEDTFSIGFTARNVLVDERSFGIYGSFGGIDGLNLTAGFGINDEGVGEYEVAGNVLMLGASYDYDDKDMAFAFDFATNFTNEDSDADLYLGATWNWGFTDDWECGLELLGGWDFNTDPAAGTFRVHPSATWSHGIHSVEAGVQFDFSEDVFGVCFPVSYTIEF